MVILTIIRPEREPEVVTFEHPTEVSIGRSAGCGFCLDYDPMVSRMHAVLLVEPPIVCIKDLNSTNGLAINGEIFGGYGSDNLVQQRELFDGDEISIGATKFRIKITDAESAPGSKPTRAVRYEEKSTVVSSRYAADMKHGEQANGNLEETVGSVPPAFPEAPGYRTKGQIGSGRMGDVYQVTARDGGELAAMKIINPDVAFSKKMLDDFRHELEGVKALRHPNLARILSTGALGPKSIYLITEYVNGEDMGSYLKRCPNGRVPLHAAFGLMRQIATAMCHAHSHGFVHRSLRPENIILYDENGKLMIKITGIGVSKCLEDAGITGLTPVAPKTENLAYMAPEQLAELRDHKPVGDVFAVAAVFYQMLTGHAPYNFVSEDPRENRAVVANADIIPIEERLPGLPEPLVVVMDRALSGESDDRYQNCCDFLDALENVRV